MDFFNTDIVLRVLNAFVNCPEPMDRYTLVYENVDQSWRTTRDVCLAVEDISIELTLTTYILIVMLILAVLTALFSTIGHKTENKFLLWWSNFWQGVSTELVGAIITTILLGMIILVSQQYQSNLDIREEIIQQMGSFDHARAMVAIRRLTLADNLADGSVDGYNFLGADWSGGILSNARLSNLDMYGSDLDNMEWYDISVNCINFSDASMIDLRMTDSTITDTTFFGVDFGDGFLSAVFVNVDMTYVAFTSGGFGGSFTDVSFTGADLSGAQVSTGTTFTNVTLPDGSTLQEPNDIDRFLDPDHPNFWDINTQRQSINVSGGRDIDGMRSPNCSIPHGDFGFG